MKKILILLITACCLSATPTRAQSTSDLITQLVLDYDKLAELKGILQDMYKAYDIINKGYTDIKNIAEGNFNLHKLFLDGLLAISPAVQNYHRVLDIINAEYNIVREYKAASANAHAGNMFTLQELGYMDNMYTALFNRSLRCIDELTMVLTASELRMSDAQRLQAIDRIYGDISGQLSFLRSFNNSATSQSLQRQKEYNDINTIKLLYGNPD